MARTQQQKNTAPSPTLLAAREATRTETVAAARKFELAAEWAEAHPAPVEDAVVDDLGHLVMFGDQPITIAGEGAPGMSEFAVAEFAAACGMTTYAGRDFIGSAVESKYRLPRIWARVVAGEVPVWKVRRVTPHTHRLDPHAAAYVDRELAPILHTCTYKQIEQAVETAAAEADTEYYEEERAERWNTQHLDISLSDAHLNHGLVPISGLLDYADALALDQALQAGAKQLALEHPDLGLDLDVRRAMAAGRLASGTGTGTSAPAGGSREVVVYAHHTPSEAHGIVDVEKLGQTTVEHLTDWCQTWATKITIKPVIDLDTELATDAYTPTARQREQVALTLPTCVFPGCAHPARTCDLDHITPYNKGGETTSWNLAPLCRLHHRLKTLGFWTYTRLTRTSFEWTSPSGLTYDVDLTYKRRRTR